MEQLIEFCEIYGCSVICRHDYEKDCTVIVVTQDNDKYERIITSAEDKWIKKGQCPNLLIGRIIGEAVVYFNRKKED